jgi:hypothetical protein
MKYNHITVVLLIAVLFVASCKKVENTPTPSADSTAAATAPKDTLKDQAAQWAAFKTDANAKIQALQDSLDAYDARMKAANPHYKADMKRREEIKRRAAALKAKLAEPKDEAVGSFGRMKDAIVGGIDTLATGVANIVSPSKKK